MPTPDMSTTITLAALTLIGLTIILTVWLDRLAGRTITHAIGDSLDTPDWWAQPDLPDDTLERIVRMVSDHEEDLRYDETTGDVEWSPRPPEWNPIAQARATLATRSLELPPTTYGERFIGGEVETTLAARSLELPTETIPVTPAPPRPALGLPDPALYAYITTHDGNGQPLDVGFISEQGEAVAGGGRPWLHVPAGGYVEVTVSDTGELYRIPMPSGMRVTRIAVLDRQQLEPWLVRGQDHRAPRHRVDETPHPYTDPRAVELELEASLEASRAYEAEQAEHYQDLAADAGWHEDLDSQFDRLRVMLERFRGTPEQRAMLEAHYVSAEQAAVRRWGPNLDRWVAALQESAGMGDSDA